MNKKLKTTRGLFNVRTYGDTEKPVLILLHGWPQTSYCWHHVSPFLDDFYILAPDLRGMGESNRALDMHLYQKDEMAKDIFAIADHLEIPRFFLAGHDWGGAVAQEMAFLYPERIKKLVILNMIILNNATGLAKAADIMVQQLFRSSWYQFFMSIPAFPEAMIAGKEDIWVRFFSRGISKPIPEDAILEYIRCYKIPNTITTAANLYRNMPKDRERWNNFVGRIVEIPTNIIHGTLDPVIIEEYLSGVEAFFKSVKITRLKGGHFILDEQPKEVGQAMKKFLQT